MPPSLRARSSLAPVLVALLLAAALATTLLLGRARTSVPPEAAAPVASAGRADRKQVEVRPEPAELAPLEREPVADAAPPPRSAAASSGTEAPAAPPSRAEKLHARIAALADTFLTDEPDCPAMSEALTELASLLEVDPESVTRDPLTGKVSGTLATDPPAIACGFEIEDGRYSVNLLEPPGTVAAGDFLLRGIHLRFGEDLGETSTMTVQHHPDTRRSPHDLLAEGEERIVGWGVAQGAGAVEAQPLSMRRAPGGEAGLVIGHSDRLRARKDPWAGDLRPDRILRVKLGPFAGAR